MEKLILSQNPGTQKNQAAAAKIGDKEAFAGLIQDNKSSMYRLAKNILARTEDVEDAIGETVVKAFININKLKDTNNFRAWVLKILINECYNILRKAKREVSTEDTQLDIFAHEDNYTNIDLKKAINQLDTNHRVIVILFYYEDMSVSEIAKILSLSEGTVKSRLSRSREKLIKLLGK